MYIPKIIRHPAYTAIHDDAKMYDRILIRTDIDIQRHYYQRVGFRFKSHLKFVKITLKCFSETFRCGSTENI